MVEKKIVFFGPVGAGKTTAIRAASDKGSIDTEASVSDNSLLRKQHTTVALDYGVIQRKTLRIHLYGTPGQQRFRFMWEMIGRELAPDSAGYILLLDYQRNHPGQDLKYYLHQFAEYLKTAPLLIAVTGSDLTDSPDYALFKAILEQQKCRAPLYFIDGRNASHIHFLVQQLLQPDLHKTTPPGVQSLSALTSIRPEGTLPIAPDADAPEPRLRRQQAKQYFHPALLHAVEGLQQVTGIALINRNGLSEYSSLPEYHFHEMSQFTASLLKKIPELEGFEYIRSTEMNRDTDGFFTLLVADSKILGVHASGKTTRLTLQQEIENLLQWGPEQ